MNPNHNHTLNNLAARNIRPLALGLGIYYLAMSAAHILVLAGPSRTAIVSLSSLSAAFYIAIWYCRRSHPADPFHSHRSEFFMAAVVMATSLGHLAALPDPIHTSNVAIAVIGGGLLFLSTRWYAAFLTLGLIGWILLIPLYPPDGPITHYGFIIGGSVIVSSTAFVIRRKDLGDLESSRLLAQEIELRLRTEFEKRQLQEQLARADKMSSLGILAAGIAHDFGDILSIISVNAKPAAGEVDTANASLRFSNIALAANRAACIKNEMLAFSGHSAPNKMPTDLLTVVGSVNTQLSDSITRPVQIRIPDAGDPSVVVQADPSQLEQIALNLLLNAVEALDPDGGSVTVTTGTMDVDTDFSAFTFSSSTLRPGSYGYLRVVDTGPGISPENLQIIFDPFYSTKFNGRGLGLASVAGILLAHQGAIKVDSTPGCGSTFTVLLPLSDTAVQSETYYQDPFEGWNPSGLSALVVDDEPVEADLTAAVLKAAGFDARVAYGGHEGLDAFKSFDSPPAIVVVGATMPGLGGTALITAIREIQPDAAAILISGHHNAEHRTDSGAQPPPLVKKPFTSRELLWSVRQLLDNGFGQMDAGV